jgi:hypothetical protein
MRYFLLAAAVVGIGLNNQTPMKLSVEIQAYQVCKGKVVYGVPAYRDLPVGLSIAWSTAELPSVTACDSTVNYIMTVRPTDQ